MDLKNVLEKNEDVQLIFNGFKKKDGKYLYKDFEVVPSLVFGVEEKKDPTEIKKSNLIPKKIDGTLTDVIPVGKIKMLTDLDPTKRYNPMYGGISAANLRETAGTITGAVVYKGGVRLTSTPVYTSYGLWSWFINLFRRRPTVPTPNPWYKPISKFMASNYHVFVGDNGKLGDYIIQPGPYDLGRTPVGRLIDYVPLSIDGYNQVDGAVCQLFDDNDVLFEQLNLGGYNRVIGKVKPGDIVSKYGRTTNHTLGRVEGIDAMSKVWYGDNILKWENQIIISNVYPNKPFSLPGDSGSMILDYLNAVVGVLYAGSEEITLANHASKFAELLKIEF